MTGTPEDEGPWCSDEMECEYCGRAWVSVHPCCERVECPGCGRMTKSTMALEHEAWMRRQQETR